MNLLGREYTQLGACVLVSQPPCGSDFALTQAQRNLLNTIESDYTIHLEDKQYQNIPTDLVAYLKLLSLLADTQAAYGKNKDITLLLKIVKEALEGAMNAYGMNVDIIRLTIDNKYLNEILQQFMSGQNLHKVFDTTEGTFHILKDLDFAPLFKYYIQIYGLPAPGQGFDINTLTLVYNTLIANGIDPGVASIADIPAVSDCTLNAIMLSLYTKLSAFILTVKNITEMYNAGNLDPLTTLLTRPVYDLLSTQIDALRISPDAQAQARAQAQTLSTSVSPLAYQYVEYENIRYHTAAALGGLFAAITEHKKLVEATTKIISDKERLSILEDGTKLKAYVEDFFGHSRAVLPDQSITVKTAKLKPQYAEYVRLYGYPEGGVFDMDKLGEIIIRLGINVSKISVPK